MTPAAVTQQLARAERACQTQLVRRGPRGASLTPAGTLLARHGQAIEEQMRQAGGALSRLLGQLAQQLHVGAFQAAALHLLPPALRHQHPTADLTVTDITSDRGTPAVDSGGLDVAVIAAWDSEPTVPEHVRRHALLTDPMVLVLPDDHRLAGRPGPIHLEELRSEAWVTIRAGHAAREQFDRACTSAGFEPRVRFQTESYDVAQALVSTGIGVALVSRLALTNVAGTTSRPLAARSLHRQLFAITPADTTLTPLVEVFLHLLFDVSSDLRRVWKVAE